jgi:hypothetical protein
MLEWKDIMARKMHQKVMPELESLLHYEWILSRLNEEIK